MGSQGKKHLYLTEGEKVTLEFTPEGETEVQVEEKVCAMAQRQ